MKKVKQMLKVGTVIPTPIRQEHINDSDPCNKDNCMLHRGATDLLVSEFGGKASDYRVKSTNHGLIFRVNGREIMTVFDTKTGNRIYNYDRVYTTKRSKEAARASVKPFVARLMIESTSKLPVFPPMSQETKEKLRKYPKKKSREEYQPKKTGSRRELSL